MQIKQEKMIESDTICAIATATGGALGIIRISGTKAIEVVDKIFLPVGKDKRKLLDRDAYTIVFGTIVDGNNDNEIVDEVLVSIFRAPHSYTGEDSIEISCHGSSYILQRTMQLLIANGCRAAGPGEYTQRAFLNGKMDLSQAEAVADLIASNTAASHRIAMNQMRGAFSSELAKLRDELLHLTSLMELELDFSDHEELEFADRSELNDIAGKIYRIINKLVESFKLGNAIKNGIPVAIIGETNAGKSTLLNKLVGEERAIVSDIHGTTRDVIEDTINISGINFRFIDTAGIRETQDKIENIGIERTLEKVKQAEIVIILIDATKAKEQYLELAQKVGHLCTGKKVFFVLNKTDIVSSYSEFVPFINEVDFMGMTTADAFSEDCNPDIIAISAKTGEGINELRSALASYSSQMQDYSNNVVVSNLRHLSSLKSALSDINRVIDGLHMDIPTDLLSQDLRSCLYHLGEITGGEIQTDEVLGNIFSHFCIGK